MNASDAYGLRLQVGRIFSGSALSALVFLREIPLLLLGGDSAGVAPAWVVVEDRATGQDLWRVKAGRGYGVGEHLLASMQADLEAMAAEEFLQQWRT